MPTLMYCLRKEQDKLDLEEENSHGDYEKMKVVFGNKIQLYKRYLMKEDLSELDRLRLENKNECINSHMLEFMEDKKSTLKSSSLTKRVYEIEGTVQALQDFINSKER